MFFSSSSLFTVFIFSSLLTVILWFYLKSVKRIMQFGIGTFLACVVMILVRMLLPVEFTFADSLGVRYLLPQITELLDTPILHAGQVVFTPVYILMIVWVVGILLFAIRSIRSYFKAKHVVIRQPLVQDPDVLLLLKDIVQTYKKSVDFRLVHADFITTPMLFGLRYPKIIVPATDFTPKEWHFILSHEVAHYYHGDLYLKLLTEILHIIYWWNPFFCLLNRQIEKMLEISVDLRITKDLSESERIQYLDCLLHVAERFSPEREGNLSVALGSPNSSALLQRFHMVLHHGTTKFRFRYLKNFFLAFPIFALLIFSDFFVLEPYAIDPIEAEGTFELTKETSYLVINPDGGYDIYINHQYCSTISEIDDSFSDLYIYQNPEEAKQHEINH